MSASKEAPHGKLSFVLHGSGAEETFDRGLTDQQLAYVNAFPLSVCNSVQDMAYPNPRHKVDPLPTPHQEPGLCGHTITRVLEGRVCMYATNVFSPRTKCTSWSALRFTTSTIMRKKSLTPRSKSSRPTSWALA